MAVILRNSNAVFLVGDIASTMKWYQENLGFEADPFPSKPPHAFCILTRGGVDIMLQQLAGYEKPDLYARREGGVWSVYIQMEGIRELYEQVSKLPAVTVLVPLGHQPYGQIEFEVRDPNGYVLVFAESALTYSASS